MPAESQLFNRLRTSVRTNKKNIGSVPTAVSSYITAKEYGDGINNKALLTITDLPFPLGAIAATNAIQVAGIQLYDFPVAKILPGNSMLSLTFSYASALSSYISTALDGDFGLGTTEVDSAQALGTDTSDVDIVPSKAISLTVAGLGATVSSQAAAGNVSAILDGTATALDCFLNLAIDTGEFQAIATDFPLTVTGYVMLDYTILATS